MRTTTLVVPGSALPDGAAHVVNLTATGSSGNGYLTAWRGEGTLTPTSSVNFLTAENAPNLATAGSGSDGRIAVTVKFSDVHTVVDHLGYFR